MSAIPNYGGAAAACSSGGCSGGCSGALPATKMAPAAQAGAGLVCGQRRLLLAWQACAPAAAATLRRPMLTSTTCPPPPPPPPLSPGKTSEGTNASHHRWGLDRVPTPREIVAHLDQYVVGQVRPAPALCQTDACFAAGAPGTGPLLGGKGRRWRAHGLVAVVVQPLGHGRRAASSTAPSRAW